MKKWYYLLLAAFLPMLASSLSSCSDDKDLPNVDISLNIAEGTVSDDVIYVAQGDTIKIASIDVTNNEAGKAATIANVAYYWDGIFYAPAVYSPFGMIFPTSSVTPLGNHTIDITCNVLAVDKSIGVARIGVPVKVVASPEDIPDADPNPQIVKNTSVE